MPFVRRTVGEPIHPDHINELQIGIEGIQSTVQETARDTIGTALVAGTGVTVTVSDATDKITLALDESLVIALALVL